MITYRLTSNQLVIDSLEPHFIAISDSYTQMVGPHHSGLLELIPAEAADAGSLIWGAAAKAGISTVARRGLHYFHANLVEYAGKWLFA